MGECAANSLAPSGCAAWSCAVVLSGAVRAESATRTSTHERFS